MPDESASTSETQPTTEKPKEVMPAEAKSTPVEIPPDLKKALAEKTGSVGKKILWWVLGILGVIGALVGIVCLLKMKGPLSAAEDVIKTSKAEIAKSDIEAKIKLAEAKNAEKKVVDKLKEIKEIDDEVKALEELNKLLGPS